MDHPIAITYDDDVMQICLNRPDKLNSFSADLVEALMSAIDAAGAESARLVVFRGAGKGFSGGFDLGGLENMSDGDLLLRFVQVEELLQAVFHAPFATLALVHGVCYGAAADLVAACRYRVAAPDARFRMPGSRFGVVLGTSRLARLVGADSARALLLREGAFDSAEAHETAFLNEVCDQDGWPAIIERQLEAARSLDHQTHSDLLAAMTQDTRDADLAALVRSVSRGSIKRRVETYLAQVRSTRKS